MMQWYASQKIILRTAGRRPILLVLLSCTESNNLLRVSLHFASFAEQLDFHYGL